MTSAPVKRFEKVPRFERWLLVLVLLATFWHGARGLFADTAWSDENSSFEDAGGFSGRVLSLAEIWALKAETDQWNLPGYYFALSAWARLVGWEPPALRALSLLAGLLAIAWTYRLGCDVISRRVGLYAAVVMGASAFLAHYLHEMRTYTIVTMLVAFEVWLYYRMVTRARPPTRLEWLGLFGGAVWLLYSHYFALMPLFGLGVYHLLFVRRNRRWRQITAVFALAGAVYMVWIVTVLSNLNLSPTPESTRRTALTAAQTLDTFVRLASNGFAALLVVVVASALASRRRNLRLPLTIVLGALLLLIAVNTALRIMDAGRVRYLLMSWSAVSVIVALGIVQLGCWLPVSPAARRVIPPLMLAGWFGIGLARIADDNFLRGLDGMTYRFQVHHAAYAIRDEIQPDDLVLQYVPDVRGHNAVGAARRGYRVYFRDPRGEFVIYPQAAAGAERERELSELAGELPGRGRVWLIFDPSLPTPDMPRVIEALEAGYRQCRRVVDLLSVRVEEYASPQACCLPGLNARTARWQFGDGIRLVDYERLPETVTGGSLWIGGLWSLAADVPLHRYSTSFQVFDAHGNRVAQYDRGLTPEAEQCARAEISIADLPPGGYELGVAVYAWQTGERLPGTDSVTGQTADMLPLQSFRIAG